MKKIRSDLAWPRPQTVLLYVAVVQTRSVDLFFVKFELVFLANLRMGVLNDKFEAFVEKINYSEVS